MASLDLRFVADPPVRQILGEALPQDDPLLCFDAESPIGPAVSDSVVPVGRRLRGPALMAALGAALMLMALAAVRTWEGPAAASPVAANTSGAVDITSQPSGVAVTIDGLPRGVTPLRLSLESGPHLAELISGGITSSLPLVVDAGAVLRQHITFASHTAGSGLPIGVGTAANDPVGRVIPASPGAATVAAADPRAAAMGWVRLQAPIEVHASEGTRLLEPSASGRLRLPPGRHDLEIANAAFDFRAKLRLNVEPGRTITVPVAIPNGNLSITAVPWADVSVDARPVGVTPLGNLSIPIGLHEVIWRHPQLGERRQMVTLTERTPVGLAMDLTN